MSSPGDVASARELTAQIIEKVAPRYARFFVLEPYLWEYEPMLASGSFQDSIDVPGSFDIVILILESRLGTLLPERTSLREYRGADGRAPVTGTEWEFEDALRAARATGTPQLLVYRSKRNTQISSWDPEQRQAVLKQLEALDTFWARHFANRGRFIGAYTEYVSLENFATRLERDLCRCVEKRIEALGQAKHERPVRIWFHDPFRGLESYEFEHKPIFFGREQVIGTALSRLLSNAEAKRPFLIVLGASGSGKSSLVKAGLVPRLLVPQRVTGTAFLRRVIFRASEALETEDLFDALARCLTRAESENVGLPELLGNSTTVENVARHLRESVDHPELPLRMVLGDLERRARDRGEILRFEQGRLILIVDQLEEIFTSGRVTAEKRTRFVRLLASLVRSELVWVVATMRSDFWHLARVVPELVQLADGQGRLDLLPPTPAEINQMIRGPADAAYVAFETPQDTDIPLNDRIAEEAANDPGSLALLSYLLDQIYLEDVKKNGGSALTYATYKELGGLRGAIAKRADTVLDAAPKEVSAALGEVLFSLVEIEESAAIGMRPVARRALLDDFPEGTSRRRLVDALLDPGARLLVSEAPKDQPVTVRLAHEALITEWKKANACVERNLDLLRIRRTLEDRHSRWKALVVQREAAANASEFSPDPDLGLLTDIGLSDGQRLLREYPNQLAPPLIEFIDRSIQKHRRESRRQLRRLSAFALALAGFSILATVAWIRELNERRVAQDELATSDNIRHFMVNLFDKADPDKSHGEEITARQMLDQGARGIRSDPAIADESRVRAELFTTMAKAYLGLGLYRPAEEMLANARASEKAGVIPDDLRVDTLVASGTVRFLLEDDKGALAFQKDAVAKAHSLPPGNTLRSAALTGLGDTLVDTGQYDQAQALYREAEHADRLRGTGIEATSVLTNTLDSEGAAYFIEGKYSQALAPWSEALRLRKQVLGMRDPQTAASLNNMASLLYQTAHYAEAADTYREALPVFHAVYGNEHPKVASLLNNLGRSALIAGRLDEGEQQSRASLEMAEKLEGPEHSDLIAPLNSLAMIDAYRGRQSTARCEITRAECIARKQDPDKLLEQVLVNEADLDVADCALNNAEKRLTEARQLLPDSYKDDPNNSWRLSVWNLVNAGLESAQGDTTTAVNTISAARPILIARFGPDSFYPMLAQRREQSLRNPVKCTQDKSPPLSSPSMCKSASASSCSPSQ